MKLKVKVSQSVLKHQIYLGQQSQSRFSQASNRKKSQRWLLLAWRMKGSHSQSDHIKSRDRFFSDSLVPQGTTFCSPPEWDRKLIVPWQLQMRIQSSGCCFLCYKAQSRKHSTCLTYRMRNNECLLFPISKLVIKLPENKLENLVICYHCPLLLSYDSVCCISFISCLLCSQDLESWDGRILR